MSGKDGAHGDASLVVQVAYGLKLAGPQVGDVNGHGGCAGPETEVVTVGIGGPEDSQEDRGLVGPEQFPALRGIVVPF